MMFDRRLIHYFDWGLLSLTIMIGMIGILLLRSAISCGEAELHAVIFYKQLVWYCIGSICMTICFLFHYKHFEKWGPLIYVISIILLLCVHLVGKHIGGSTRWLVIGPLTLQPSEPAKIAVIIMLSRYLSKNITKSGLSFRTLILPAVLTGVPFLLIATQPDLGTAGTIALIAISMTLFAKIERRTLIASFVLLVLIIPLGWQFLQPYQKERVRTMLSQDSDPLGAGYHIRQSKIAVGSGMLFGKGYMQGTQKMLSFLPEQHTDFIFSVIAEEWGFVGSIVLLCMYLILIAFAINIGHSCRDAFGIMLSVGITFMIFWQTFINTAMIMGILPVVGMPFPLISYGGSSVITVFISIGILLNISMRRFMKE